MKKIAVVVVLVLIAASAAMGANPHPRRAHHVFVKQLCTSVRFEFPIPRNNVSVYIDEWVNGKETTAYAEGKNIIYFWGSNVSGRYVQITKNRGLIQAVHFIPGCVRLRVEWWHA